MPVNFIQERKKQNYLAVLAVVLFVAAFLILWFGFNKGKSPVFNPPFDYRPSDSLLKEIKIDFEVLKNPLLKELQPFVKAPPYEGGVGRENPFESY